MSTFKVTKVDISAKVVTVESCADKPTDLESYDWASCFKGTISGRFVSDNPFGPFVYEDFNSEAIVKSVSRLAKLDW